MQNITISVPDDFTEMDIIHIKKIALMEIERIIRSNEVAPKEIKEANDKTIADIRTAMSSVIVKPIETKID